CVRTGGRLLRVFYREGCRAKRIQDTLYRGRDPGDLRRSIRRRAERARRPGRCAPGQRTTTEPEIIPRLNIRPKDIRRYLRFLRELVLEQIPGKTLFLIETILKITRQITSLLIPILVTIALGIVIYM